MKRRLAVMVIMGLALFITACGGKGKADESNSSASDSVAQESSEDEKKADSEDESGDITTSGDQDISISTENVPAVVVSDFEDAAADVEKLTGGKFREEEVCYETYTYSDESGKFRWDGKGLEIVLQANPTTGYFWTIKQFGEKNSFSVTNDEYVSDQAGTPEEPLVGVGGVQNYYLTPKTRGGDAFVLDYSKQNSDGSRDPALVYLLCAHADEGDEITFSIRRYTVTEQ